jgi:hypothetical protein
VRKRASNIAKGLEFGGPENGEWQRHDGGVEE